MEQSRFPLLIALLLGISAAGYAQQLSFTNPSGLAVCDSAFFQVQVSNDSSVLLEGAQLEVALPPCLQALNPAQISLPPIGPSQTLTFSFGIFAPCPCYGEVNAGAIFANEIRLLAWGDTLSLNTNPYPVETAQLVITQVSNTVLSGSKGEMLSRTFTVQNTRPGPLTSFLFEDFHQPGIQLSSPQGTVEADQPGYFALRLDGMDFQSIGDGDELFEQGETLTLTENILLTSCGFDNPSSLSNISFSWGCGGASCQSVQQTALVQFEISDMEAKLEIIPQIAAPVCFCAEEGLGQGLQIVNTGEEPAFGLSFSIRQQSEGTALDPLSAIGLLNGNPVVLGIQGTQNVSFESPCQEGGLLWEKLVIACPDLQPGDTLLLKWDVFFCNPDCAQSQNRWVYEYQFEKSCPPDQFIDSDTFQVSLNNPTLSAQLSGDFQLEDGETSTFTYSIQYDSLALIQGQLAVSMTLPCGLVWENNPMLLNGVAPDVLSLEVQDSTLLVSALYPLPLPGTMASLSFDLSFYCDSLCQPGFACADSLLTSCPQPECSVEPGPVLQIDIQTTLLTCEGLPSSCGLQSCDLATIAISCVPDSVCVDTIAGYVWFGMDFQRISLGAPDNDNDRWPDGTGFLDPSLLRLDRSMPGDTVQTVLSGLVISDEPNGEFGFSAAWISFLPVGADPFINPDLFAPEGIAALEAVLDIWDADAGLSYSCPGISTTPETTSDRLIYHYAINPSDLLAVGCPLPSDFRWEDGDSIKLTALHRLDANPVKQSSTAPTPPVFPVAVRSLLSIGQTEAETTLDPFVCGCDFATWEITGYEYELLPGLFAIPFCDTSGYQGASLFNLELGLGNFFPYEYRPLGFVPDFHLDIPAEISLAEAQVKQFTLQGGPSWQGVAPLAGAESNGTWTFNLASFQNPPADEGFYFFLQYRFTADCEAEGAYPLGLEALLEFAPGISDGVLVEAEENALKPLFPTLQLFNPLPDQLALDNKARWDFTLSNVPNSVSGQQSGTAPFIWLAPFSTSGLLSDFTLTDTQSGQSLPFSNGIFQLDSLPASQSRSLQLSALNGSCLEETVEIRYGFGCEPFLSPDQTPCQSEVQYWTVLAPPGGVDFTLSFPEDTCALLCDTVPYHTIELYNTNLGPVCNPWVEAILPQGLSITPGSSGLAYPSGSPFVPMGDPLDMGNGVFRWNLVSGSPELAANCLSGLGRLHCTK
ncbi:MAG: hypothetical protein IPJ00_08075 [Saprospirales bacterium]|nr:hypothetical protein [Saprospirales bacterium]